MATATVDGSPIFPVRFAVERPDGQSRITNFPLAIGTVIRGILLIPHFIILYLLQIAANVVYLIATFAILFTGRYPATLYSFYVGYMRWSANAYAYMAHLYDSYPPFSLEQQTFPLTLDVDYPDELNRLLNFPILGIIVKMILLIPHFILLFFLYIAAIVAILVAQFAILFTGAFPEGLYRFVEGVGRWYMRVQGYLIALTDRYPPFSLS